MTGKTDLHNIYAAKLDELYGRIPYTLRNDVVFHLAMERNPMVTLRGLLSSLLNIPPEEITHLQILNPIDLKSVIDKSIILDVKAEVNHQKLIDIELQMYYDSEWTERSLLYLCRTYDQLYAGESYKNISETAHIAIVNRPVFESDPEFYARYRLQNIATGKLYTDRFCLNVLDISNITLATEEDCSQGLDRWARLFRASRWEELRKAAGTDPLFREVAISMAISNLSREERYLIEAQERYQLTLDSLTRQRNAQKLELAKKEQQVSTLERQIAALSQQLVEQGQQISALLQELKELRETKQS